MGMEKGGKNEKVVFVGVSEMWELSLGVLHLRTQTTPEVVEFSLQGRRAKRDKSDIAGIGGTGGTGGADMLRALLFSPVGEKGENGILSETGSR